MHDPNVRKNAKTISQHLCNEEINLCNEKLYITQLLNNRTNVEQHDIDLICNSLCDIMKESAKKCGCFSEVKNKRRKRMCKKQPWFYNRECEERRRDFMRALNAEKEVKNEETKAVRIAASKAYKRTINKQFVEQAYKRNIVRKIRELKSKDPKGQAYWAILNGNSDQKSKQMGKINLETCVYHFKTLNIEDNEQVDFNLDDINTTGNLNLNRIFTIEEIKKNRAKVKK